MVPFPFLALPLKGFCAHHCACHFHDSIMWWKPSLSTVCMEVFTLPLAFTFQVQAVLLFAIYWVSLVKSESHTSKEDRFSCHFPGNHCWSQLSGRKTSLNAGQYWCFEKVFVIIIIPAWQSYSSPSTNLITSISRSATESLSWPPQIKNQDLNPSCCDRSSGLSGSIQLAL